MIVVAWALSGTPNLRRATQQWRRLLRSKGTVVVGGNLFGVNKLQEICGDCSCEWTRQVPALSHRHVLSTPHSLGKWQAQTRSRGYTRLPPCLTSSGMKFGTDSRVFATLAFGKTQCSGICQWWSIAQNRVYFNLWTFPTFTPNAKQGFTGTGKSKNSPPPTRVLAAAQI